MGTTNALVPSFKIIENHWHFRASCFGKESVVPKLEAMLTLP